MKVLYIPEGIANLQQIFPTINFNDVDEYSVVVHGENNEPMAESRTIRLDCCCNEEKIRINFINSIGEIDSINFFRAIEETETKSDSWEKSLKFPLDKTLGGNYRLNTQSNENYEAETKCWSEKEQYWIKELLSTPKAWIEMKLPNGFLESDEKQYIPIIIADSKIITRKNELRYEYIVKIKFSMSNENITLR